MFRRIFNRHCAFRDENRGKGIFSFKFIVTSSVLLRKKKRKGKGIVQKGDDRTKRGKIIALSACQKLLLKLSKSFFFSLRVSHGYLSCKLREQSNSKVVELQSKKKSKQFFVIILRS